MMKRLSTGLFILAILFLISFARPMQAQAAASASKVAARFSYDSTQEVTLSGTVVSVRTKGAPGMMAGSHLLLESQSGVVDASLGRFGLAGYGAVSVSGGEKIEATGVMRTIKDKPVFVVRTVSAGGKVYSVRNEHGSVLTPQARERAGQKTGQKGESQ
jgi:hypothetical protein